MEPTGEHNFSCPYCGSSNALTVDYSQTGVQKFVVDCEVCCRPVKIRMRLNGTHVDDFEASGENA